MRNALVGINAYVKNAVFKLTNRNHPAFKQNIDRVVYNKFTQSALETVYVLLTVRKKFKLVENIF